jgi:hypothetical protein
MERDYTKDPVEVVFDLTAIHKHTGQSVSFSIPYNPLLADIINTEHKDYMTFIDVRVTN